MEEKEAEARSKYRANDDVTQVVHPKNDTGEGNTRGDE